MQVESERRLNKANTESDPKKMAHKDASSKDENGSSSDKESQEYGEGGEEKYRDTPLVDKLLGSESDGGVDSKGVPRTNLRAADPDKIFFRGLQGGRER